MHRNAHGAPSELEHRLRAWHEAGLLDEQQILPIVQFEDERHAPRSRVPIAAEAVGYVGAALVIGAVVSLVANHFDDMAVATRVLTIGVPAALTAIAGWYVGRVPDPAFERLGSVLWTLSVGLLAGTLAEVFVDAMNDRDPPAHGGVLFVAGVALVWAAAAYALRPLPLQHAVMFAASLATMLGVLDVVEWARDASLSGVVWGFAVWLFGVAWTAAGLQRLLTPPIVAKVLGAATVLVGAQIVCGASRLTGLWLGIASAGALLLLGVIRSDALVLLAGAVGLFQWSPQLAIYYLKPAIGTEATLLVVGILLLASAASFTKLYRRMRAGADAAA